MVLVFHYKNYMSKSVCEIVLPFFGKTKFLRVQRTRFLPQLLYLELFSFQCATRSGASLWKNPFARQRDVYKRQPVTLRALAERVKKALKITDLRYAGDDGQLVSRIAVNSGGGTSLIETALAQGLTTLVGGNCGMSLAPLAGEHAPAVRAYLAPITGAFGDELCFASLADYFAAAEQTPQLVNNAMLAGMGTLLSLIHISRSGGCSTRRTTTRSSARQPTRCF